jgi:hypothetical protein
MNELDRVIKKYFSYLIAEYSFAVTAKEDFSYHNGGFMIRLEKGDIQITITRERGQIFIDFFTPKMGKIDKESILAKNGISRDRYPTKDYLWTGYEIKNQSIDLKKHIELILTYIRGTALA